MRYTGIVAACCILMLLAGCSNDGGTTAPPVSTCSAADSTRYGSGVTSFLLDSPHDSVTIRGRYKPSAQFGSDTSSRGAGGFVRDTTISGQHLIARFAAYEQSMTHAGTNQRLLILTLNDTVRLPTPGIYQVTMSPQVSAGRSAYGFYLRYSDSLGIFQTYEMLSGTVTVISVDTCAHHCSGIFSGTLRGSPPDTTTFITLTHGEFDLQFSRRPFVY